MTENTNTKMAMEQKCPGCGHTVEFDPSSQNILCDSCGSKYTPGSIGDESCLFEDKRFWEDNEAILYHCPSCGGDLIFGKDDVATKCAYCGNNLVLGERLTGDRRPNRIIPFRFDKKIAEQKLRAYLEKHVNRNKEFCTKSKLIRLEGLYIPVWTYSTKMYGKATVKCYSKSSEGATTLSYAGRTRRGGSAIYYNVPVDGSSKMPDALMESIEPYNFKKSVPFNTSYLLGFGAQKYDLDEATCYRRAKQRMSNHLLTLLRKEVSNFEKLDTIDMIAKAPITFVNYIMVPVWIATLEWEGKKHTFIINGQTGRTRGEIPTDSKSIRVKKATMLALMHIPSLLILLASVILGFNLILPMVIVILLEMPIMYGFKFIGWSMRKGEAMVKLRYGAELYYDTNSLNIMFRDRMYRQ